jgi:hypothetical protein
VETLTDTLMTRVAELVPESTAVEWGHPALTTTPASVAIAELAQRTTAIEAALREIAREVQKLTEQTRTASG